MSPHPTRRWSLLALVPVIAALAACGADSTSSTAAVGAPAMAAQHGNHGRATMDPDQQAAAMLAAAGYQDVATAEAAGYASTIDTLGCFEDATKGGMGVHYLNADLMDANVAVDQPEALVYELDATGAITGLVAHEYIVPIEAWTSRRPPRLFGQDFHKHPVLPLWVLHTWLWKDNPQGMFADWNPAVRQCPDGVPVFGVDLP